MERRMKKNPELTRYKKFVKRRLSALLSVFAAPHAERFSGAAIPNDEQRDEFTEFARTLKKAVDAMRRGEKKLRERNRVLETIAKEQTDKTLTHAFQKLHSIIEAIPDIMYVLDANARLIQWNQKLEKVTGLSSKELTQRSALAFFPPEDRPTIAAAIERVIREGYAEAEGRLVSKNGDMTPYQWTGVPLRDEQGNITGLTGVGRNIAERKQTEERLRKSDQLLREAEKIAHVGSWSWDVASNTVTWSDELCRIYGVNPAEFSGTYEAFLARVYPDDVARVNHIVQEAFKNKESFEFDHRIIRHDKTVRLLHARGHMVLDDANRVISMVGTGQDITEQRASEERIRQQASIIHTVEDAVITMDDRFIITSWNRGAELIYGWHAGDVIGCQARTVLRTEFHGTRRGKVRGQLLEKGYFRGEVMQYRKDGSSFTIEASTNAIRNESGTVVGYVSINRDVSVRKQAEAALNRWAHLFANIETGIAIGDATGERFLMANPYFVEMHGYTMEELIGRKIVDMFPQELRELAQKNLSRARRRGHFSYETNHLRRDGTVFPVAIDTTVVRDEQRRVLYYAMHVKDVTQRKRLEARLARHTKKLEEKVAERTRELAERLKEEEREKIKDEALLGSIGEGVIATDEHQRMTFINSPALQMLGWGLDEMMGKRVTDVLDARNEDGRKIPFNERASFLAIRSGEKITASHKYYVRKNGSRFPVSTTTTPVVIHETIAGAITVFRDISREKEIDRAKSEFVSLASHQLRTPLSAINWYVETLLAGKIVRIDPKERLYLSEIHHATRRMVNLVNALLNISRVELGTYVMETEPVRLRETVESILHEMETQLREKRLIIRERYQRDVPITELDPRLIRIILQNVISNAVKYTPDRGKVSITIRRDVDERASLGTEASGRRSPKGRQDVIRVSIADTGCGIPVAIQPHVFTKFTRADNVKSIDPDGTGLGLYIVKSMIGLVGGRVSYTSREHKGTTFTIELPVIHTRTESAQRTSVRPWRKDSTKQERSSIAR
ncbi:MAG: PAS domain S-box protein [Parcubacteria group bacterium]|nr:PAS domain S-box protein [Parcubacteria group bacterium]